MKIVGGKLKIQLEPYSSEFIPGHIKVSRQEISRIWHCGQDNRYYLILKVNSGTPVAYIIPPSEYDELYKYDPLLNFGATPLIITENAPAQPFSKPKKKKEKIFTNAIMELEI